MFTFHDLIVRVLTFLSALYIDLRGPYEVVSRTTPLVYKKQYPDEKTLKENHPEYHLNAVCYQVRHQMVFERWYMVNKSTYTYSVIVTITSPDGYVLDIPTMYFPELCWRIFSRTTYPHNCAIEACATKVYSVLNSISSQKRA